MQMCHSLRCKQIDMSTVDIDFSNNEERLIRESFDQYGERFIWHSG